jgi:hypothetical protein
MCHIVKSIKACKMQVSLQGLKGTFYALRLNTGRKKLP